MTTTQRFTLCVYCGSRHGAAPEYAAAARELGTAIGARGWSLVYGGGNVGLMGEVADAALAAGASVVGVIPESLMRREVGHRGLTELQVVPDMHERKRRMAERADAFVALPGGIGTFEELFEVWTWRQLGYHDKPIGVLNTGRYYDRLIEFLAHSVGQGFLDERQSRSVAVAPDVSSLLDALSAQSPGRARPDDYSKI